MLKDFGEAEEITVTKDDTLILRGKGTEEDIQKRITQIQDEIEASTSDYEKVWITLPPLLYLQLTCKY